MEKSIREEFLVFLFLLERFPRVHLYFVKSNKQTNKFIILPAFATEKSNSWKVDRFFRCHYFEKHPVEGYVCLNHVRLEENNSQKYQCQCRPLNITHPVYISVSALFRECWQFFHMLFRLVARKGLISSGVSLVPGGGGALGYFLGGYVPPGTPNKISPKIDTPF